MTLKELNEKLRSEQESQQDMWRYRASYIPVDATAWKKMTWSTNFN